MSVRSGIVLLFTVASLSVLLQANARAQHNVRLNPVIYQSEDGVFAHLGRILRATGYVGRMYYRGSCSTEGFGSVDFPRVVVHPPRGNTALKAVREMFQGDAAVQVTEEKEKILSITIGGPSTAILKTRISVLKIAPMAAYNPTGAIGVIEGTSEVKAAMAKLGLRFPLELSEQLLVKPSRGLTHLPAVMKGVTVGQALDAIAVTFQGIVAYGICPEANGMGLVEIDFVGLGQPLNSPRQ
jgi:hypothetical protein